MPSRKPSETLFLPSFERHLRAENKSAATLATYTSAVALSAKFSGQGRDRVSGKLRPKSRQDAA